jgi:hypothetical protein
MHRFEVGTNLMHYDNFDCSTRLSNESGRGCYSDDVPRDGGVLSDENKTCELTCTPGHTHVLPAVRAHDGPPLSFGSSVRLGDAHCKLLEHAIEELKIGQVHRVDAYILAQLDHDELRRGCRSSQKHVPVSDRR